MRYLCTHEYKRNFVVKRFCLLILLGVLLAPLSLSAQVVEGEGGVALDTLAIEKLLEGFDPADMPPSPMVAPLNLPSLERSALSHPADELPPIKIDPTAGVVPHDGSLYSSETYTLMPVRSTGMVTEDVGLRNTWRFNPNLSLSSHLFMQTGKYGLRAPRFFTGTANATLSYRVNERFVVSAYGQYSSAQRLSSPFATSIYGTNFGVRADYRVVDFLSLQAGAEQTYYMGQWNTNYYVTPILHIGELSIPLPSINFVPKRDRDAFQFRVEGAGQGGYVPRPPTLDEGGTRPRHWPGKN